MDKTKVLALALACGIVVGLGFMAIGWGAQFGWGEDFVDVMGTVYPGYVVGWIGGIIGGLWGFFYTVIVIGLIAGLYSLMCGNK